MNFRRIFLVKCLLLWFPNVKGKPSLSFCFLRLVLLKLHFKLFTTWWDVTDKKLVPLSQWVRCLGTFGLLLLLI